MSDLPSYPQAAAEREAASALAETPAYASWLIRAAAYLLDVVVIVIAFAAIFFVPFVVALVLPDAVAAVLLILAAIALVAFPFAYFTILHGNDRGQTLGKRAVGIRVRHDPTGGPLGYGRAFGRYAIGVVFGFFFLPIFFDYLWPLWDSKNQTLHDKVAGSIVVRA